MLDNPLEVPNAGEKEVIKKKKDINFSQQDKIISFFVNNKDVEVLKSECSLPKEEDEKRFMRDVADGKINNEDFKELLINIMPPIMKNGEVKNNSEELFKQISENKQMKSFLAQSLFRDFQKRGELKAVDLIDFYRKYPDPISFEEVIVDFMDQIKEFNPEKKYQEYVEAKKEFMQIIYGKRSEYYNQIKHLKENANEKFPELVEMRKEEKYLRISLEEKNDSVVEDILRKEFNRVFEILNKNGVISDNLNFLSDEYLSLRKESTIIKIILDEIKGDSNHYYVEMFLSLEKEVLQEFLKKVE